MNRYVRDGIVQDIMNGKHVLALFDDRVDAVEAMRDVAAEIPGAHRVYWAHGRERIEHCSGGVVHFRSIRRSSASSRGLEVDVVYTEVELTQRQLEDVIPSLNARNGELITSTESSWGVKR